MRELPASVPRDKVKEPARVSHAGEVSGVVVIVEMRNVDVDIAKKSYLAKHQNVSSVPVCMLAR